MTDKQLEKEINEIRSRNPFAFWGLLIAVVSLIQGSFIFMYSGYLIAHSEPYLRFLPEKMIGAILITAGSLKVIGVLTENITLKKIGIWGLSSIWTALFVVAFTFSFGTGYPDDSFILHLFIVAACYRVSLRGDYR